MAKELDIERLERLIGLLDDKLDALPTITVSDRDSFRNHDAALKSITDELATSEGARFGYSSGAYTLRMAAVAASCTAGNRELLRNWRRAAVLKVRNAKAGAI